MREQSHERSDGSRDASFSTMLEPISMDSGFCPRPDVMAAIFERAATRRRELRLPDRNGETRPGLRLSAILAGAARALVSRVSRLRRGHTGG